MAFLPEGTIAVADHDVQDSIYYRLGPVVGLLTPPVTQIKLRRSCMLFWLMRPLARGVIAKIPKRVRLLIRLFVRYCALSSHLLNEERSRKRTAVSQRALAPNHHGPEQSAQSFHQVLDVHLDWFTFPLQSVL